jgi:hypothetical protein
MAYDFNSAEQQRESGLIADGTIAPVHMTIRPGNAGEGGWMKRSKNGDSMALDCEFTVLEGPFAKRKFWTLFTIEGTTEGHAKAGEISASRLRAILESARGIRPDDESEAAKNGRRVTSWGDFDGIRFIAKIGIEVAKPGSGFKDKNTLDAAITPDRKTWAKVEQVAKPAGSFAPIGAAAANVAAQATAGAASAKPAWAS